MPAFGIPLLDADGRRQQLIAARGERARSEQVMPGAGRWRHADVAEVAVGLLVGAPAFLSELRNQ